MLDNSWLKKTLSSIILSAPENRLADFDSVPIFDPPITGIADGEDEVFRIFQAVVHPRHFAPRSLLGPYSSMGPTDRAVRVVSWAVPFHKQIRCSNRSREWPAELYSLARNNGGRLMHEIHLRLTNLIEAQGFRAVAPGLSEDYDAFRTPGATFASTWSERHVAYAAGLGQFALNGCLMTPLGTFVRLGSIVTDMPFRVSVSKRECHKASCLEDGGQDCGLCIKRCPARAISSEGLDKEKCYLRRQAIRDRFLEPLQKTFPLLASPIVKSGRKEMGFSLGCALCLSGVPCEEGPHPAKKESASHAGY